MSRDHLEQPTAQRVSIRCSRCGEFGWFDRDWVHDRVPSYRHRFVPEETVVKITDEALEEARGFAKAAGYRFRPDDVRGSEPGEAPSLTGQGSYVPRAQAPAPTEAQQDRLEEQHRADFENVGAGEDTFAGRGTPGSNRATADVTPGTLAPTLPEPHYDGDPWTDTDDDGGQDEIE